MEQTSKIVLSQLFSLLQNTLKISYNLNVLSGIIDLEN